jgi:hypothetical protein
MRFFEVGGLVGLFLGSSCIGSYHGVVEIFSKPPAYNLSESESFSEKDVKRNIILREFVDENLEKIMREQEKNLSFKYFGVPQILIGMPKEWRTSTMGLYRMIEDKLYLNEFHFFEDFEDFNKLNEDLVDRVLSHELGHYYSDKLAESKISENFYERSFSKEESIGLLIIQEGIAEYFRNYSGEVILDFDDSLWPSKIFMLQLGRYAYGGGHFLVKPILDKFGVEAGVEYLLNNPPKTEKELLDLPGYRHKIMNSLESKFEDYRSLK